MRVLLVFVILPVIAAAGSRCAATSASGSETMKASGPWEISVETGGGLAGKGLGAIDVKSAGDVTASDISHRCDANLGGEDLKRVAALVEKASSVKWESSYLDPASPRGEYDQVRYTMTLKTRGGEKTTYWFERSAERVPPELRDLFEELWTLRERIVANCA